MSHLLQRVSARHLSRQLLGALEALGHAAAASPELHEEVLRRLVGPLIDPPLPLSYLADKSAMCCKWCFRHWDLDKSGHALQTAA